MEGNLNALPRESDLELLLRRRLRLDFTTATTY